jgi:hypothetical protein
LRGLPENFEVKVERDNANLIYANAIGLVLTDLQPLSGQGLGTGAQTIVIEEKAAGRTQASRDKELTHCLNEWVMPNQTTFAFSEKDTRDEQARANVSSTRATERAARVASGEITPQQALQLAVDAGDAPKEFLPVDATPSTTIDDEERSDEVSEVVAGQAQPITSGIPTAAVTATDAQQISNVAESIKPSLNLNGAQVQAVMGIVSAVSSGTMTRDSGKNSLQILFGLSATQADQMLGGVAQATDTPVTTPQAVTKEVREIAALLREAIAESKAARGAK